MFREKNSDLLILCILVLSWIEPNQGQNTSPWAWHCWTPGLVLAYIWPIFIRTIEFEIKTRGNLEKMQFYHFKYQNIAQFWRFLTLFLSLTYNVGIVGAWLKKGKLLRIKFYPKKHPWLFPKWPLELSGAIFMRKISKFLILTKRFYFGCSWHFHRPFLNKSGVFSGVKFNSEPLFFSRLWPKNASLRI